MTSYLNACDVTVANSNHKNFLYSFGFPPTLKNVQPPIVPGATSIKGRANGAVHCKREGMLLQPP